jgi:hypothetical protein
VYAAFCNYMHRHLHHCNHSLASRFTFGTCCYAWSVHSIWIGTVFWGYIIILILVSCRSTKSGLAVAKKNFGSPRRRRPAKNVYTNSQRLTVNSRVTWDWSERLNLYNRQIITQQRKDKNLCYTIGP